MEALYVFEEGDAAEAAAAVGAAIGLELELRDSSFFGGDYYAVTRELDEAIVLENYMEDDGEPFFPTQPVGAVCAQVTGFDDARARLDAMPGLRPT